MEQQTKYSIDYSGLPAHMQDAMRMYIEDGIEPGGFLSAVLENNLMRAFGRADSINAAHIKDYCAFLYNDVPGNCHGSPDIVTAWINRGGLRGKEQAA